MIERFNHVGLSVSNIDRSIAFYRDLLGMEVKVAPKDFAEGPYEKIMALKGAAGRIAVVKGADLHLELFEFANPTPRAQDAARPVCDHGITHFCIEVKDIQSHYERMKAAGVVFHCEPFNFRNIAVATYARDPDGNVFEMLEMIPKEAA
jgi:catechol 2,3-dioxygenase-like lactoylglutathione lyase family enzyme